MDSTPQQPHSQDDWLLSPTTQPAPPAAEGDRPSPTEVIGDAAPVQPTDVTPRRARSQVLGAGGLVAAGLVAGVVGTFALGHHGSSTTTFQRAGQSVQQGQGGFGGLPPGLQNGLQNGTDQGQAQGQGQGQGQQGLGGPMAGFGGPPGMGGGVAGEEHVQGTVAGVSGSTLKVTTSGGTKSYAISSSTQVIRNGQPAALSQLKTGEPVVVHVITSNGSSTVERVIAGTMGGFVGGPPGAVQGSTING